MFTLRFPGQMGGGEWGFRAQVRHNSSQRSRPGWEFTPQKWSRLSEDPLCQISELHDLEFSGIFEVDRCREEVEGRVETGGAAAMENR